MTQVRIQVLLDKDMADSYKDEAKAEGRSISSLIKYKLKKYEEIMRPIALDEAPVFVGKAVRKSKQRAKV